MKRLILLCFLLIGVAQIAWAAPVAMVSQVQGKPQVRTGGQWKAARVAQKLSVGDQIKTGGGQSVSLVMVGSGARYKVEAGKTATVRPDSVAGATVIGSLTGPSARVAGRLGGARTGAIHARAPKPPIRLMPNASHWLPDNEPRFVWTPVVGANHYLFTLLDGNGNTVWSTQAETAEAIYPVGTPPLLLRTPYIWKMEPMLEGGKASPEWRWGVITFLGEADIAQLQTESAEMQQQINAAPEDWTLTLMNAELFRDYGVLGRTIEVFEDLNLTDQPGVNEALREAYAQVGPYAQFLSPLFNIVSNEPEATEVSEPAPVE